MCGIYGCIGKSDIEVTRECISRIKHRGPDAMGIKVYDDVYLAHARLSIIDISDNSDQPMVDNDGRYTIVYNGEVYNYLEIKKELKSKGYVFKTNSDTEVVLNAYIEWGEAFQDKCNGMWALAIWDNRERKLFLSRDRFGIKPLYYCQVENNLYFASEMKALLPVLGKAKINYSIFDRKDYFSYEATENSVFRNIYKIKAGHSAIYMNGKMTIKRWWNTLENLQKVPTKYEEQVEMLRDIFEDSCRIRMRSDVPIGTALSGGVDSSAIVGFMKHIQNQSQEEFNGQWRSAFVASLPDTAIDETHYAKLAAEYVDLDINKVIINPDITPEKLLEYMYLCENPYISSPIPYMQTYRSVADKGIKVTLDGHGADELFGGYPFDIVYAVSKEAPDNEIKEIYEIYLNMMGELSNKITMDDFKNMLHSKTGSSKYDIKDSLNNKLYYETHEEVLPTLLRLYDHFGMSNGVEIRMPFMDYRVVTFAFSVPWNSKLRDGYGKKIVRDMAAPYMTEKIMYRKDKIGFNSPMTEWLKKGKMKEFICDTVQSKDFNECSLVNPLSAKVMLNEFYKKDNQTFFDGESIWTAVMPYIWKKAMGV